MALGPCRRSQPSWGWCSILASCLSPGEHPRSLRHRAGGQSCSKLLRASLEGEEQALQFRCRGATHHSWVSGCDCLCRGSVLGSCDHPCL